MKVVVTLPTGHIETFEISDEKRVKLIETLFMMET